MQVRDTCSDLQAMNFDAHIEVTKRGGAAAAEGARQDVSVSLLSIIRRFNSQIPG